MAYPSEADIDAMSQQELEAYIAEQEGDDFAVGSAKTFALGMGLASLVALAVSWELIAAEMAQLKNPLTQLSCDINPLVSCGASLTIWQGNLLGVPNAFVGAMAYSAFVVLAALIWAQVKLPRWIWQGLAAGAVVNLGFVLWFVSQSVWVLNKLCPWCMVLWTATIPMAWTLLARCAVKGALPLNEASSRTLYKARWWLVGLTYLLIVLAIVFGLWQQWQAVLG